MKLETFWFNEDTGWSIDQFPEMDSEQTLVIAFADPKFLNINQPIDELAKHFSHSKIIGCSSAGEIYGPDILDDSISVAVIKFDKTIIKTANINIKSPDESYNAGVKIIKKLNDSKSLKGVFVLSEGLNINGSELVRGINSAENKNIVVTGGLSGDGSKFKHTWTLIDGNIKSGYVIAVGFYGDKINIGYGSSGGWDIFGPERVVTRSKNNILYELDYKPALELYKQYLGDKASGLPATGLLFPLSIRKDKNDQNPIVRTILAVDESNNSLTFAGDIPKGYLARLMHANFDRIITGANTAAEQTLQNHRHINKLNHSPILLIAISCVGRRLLLGERTNEETESVLEMFPKTTKQIGFYSYGEISPYAKGICNLHNQTMTLTTIGEDD